MLITSFNLVNLNDVIRKNIMFYLCTGIILLLVQYFSDLYID